MVDVMVDGPQITPINTDSAVEAALCSGRVLTADG